MKRSILLVAALLSLVHFASFEIKNPPIIRDARYYLYYSSRVALGDVPYRDFFDNKTPLSFFAGATFYRAARVLGEEPIVVIRAGYLAFAAAGGLLLLALLVRLSDGNPAPALLGLVTYCAFPLLGWLPSIGVLPKMLMAIGATATALSLERRRYTWAGAAAMLAFVDWQVGGLALLGALVAALVEPRGRLRSTGGVIVGSAAVALPFIALFASTGALRPALSQTIGTLFVRGAESAQTGLAERIAHIWSEVRVGCEGQEWIFVLGLLGMFVFPLWLRRWRDSSMHGCGLALAIYHYGVMAFSLFDFQSVGDLFILLHSVVFFAAVLLAEACRRLAVLFRRPAAVEIAFVAAFTAAVMPSILRTDFRVITSNVVPATTLDDQREVARALQELERESRTAVIGPAELLFLAEMRNAVPFVYWNRVTYGYYRRSPNDPYLSPLERELKDARVDLVVLDRTDPLAVGERTLVSSDGTYVVKIGELTRSDR